MTHVTVVGSINVDVVVRTAALPAPGETVLGSTVQRLPGGKGANQAVALARLGVPVSLVGAVGDDAEGRLSLGALDGVDVTRVDQVDAPTGLALITVDDTGENTIVVVPGANAHVVPPASADALVVQLELPLPTVAAAISAATGLVVLNAAPAMPLPAGLLRGVDVLVVNEHEALTVAGTTTVDAAIDLLLGQVRRAVVVTLGAAGCLAADAAGRHEMPSPAVDAVDAVDAVGAGDAFVGALTWALLDGRSLPDAARIACVAGSIAVTRPGARSSPTSAELRSALP